MSNDRDFGSAFAREAAGKEEDDCESCGSSESGHASFWQFNRTAAPEEEETAVAEKVESDLIRLPEKEREDVCPREGLDNCLRDHTKVNASVNIREWEAKVVPMIKAYEEWISGSKRLIEARNAPWILENERLLEAYDLPQRPIGSEAGLAPVTEEIAKVQLQRSRRQGQDQISQPTDDGASSRGSCLAIADNSISCTSMLG